MILTAQDETDLLTALYDGPFEQPLWSTFLERLRARGRALYASLIFRPLDHAPSRPLELYAGDGTRDDLRGLYGKDGHRDGRVYTLDDLLDPGDGAARTGTQHLRTIRTTEESGIGAWLTIARNGADFGAGDSVLLSSLAPHLRRALRSYVALERERFKAAAASDMIARLNFGWLALDAKARIVDLDANATRILQRFPQIRRRHDRLSLADPATDRKLAQVIRALAGDPGGRPHALTVSTEPWIDMLITPVQRRPLASSGEPIAIAYVHVDDLPTADRHEQIAELFGLLPSEARLALALSRGQTIAEAAGDLGLTVETARNYSKKIYAKMGARGQGDLIRFVLASTLALA